VAVPNRVALITAVRVVAGNTLNAFFTPGARTAIVKLPHLRMPVTLLTGRCDPDMLGGGCGPMFHLAKRVRQMAPPKKVTADVLKQIPAFIDQGLTAGDIANLIGCTVGTLRVKCSQMGISLRQKNCQRSKAARHGADGLAGGRPGLGVMPHPARPSKAPHLSSARYSNRSSIAPSARHAITLLLPQMIINQLRERAALKQISSTALIGMLLETIVRDGLYDAVLDRQEDFVQSLNELQEAS
jgi:hypothetical protein